MKIIYISDSLKLSGEITPNMSRAVCSINGFVYVTMVTMTSSRMCIIMSYKTGTSMTAERCRLCAKSTLLTEVHCVIVSTKTGVKKVGLI